MNLFMLQQGLDVEGTPSIKGYSLLEMLEAATILSELKEKTEDGKTVTYMRCAPRAIAAQFVAVSFPGQGIPQDEYDELLSPVAVVDGKGVFVINMPPEEEEPEPDA